MFICAIIKVSSIFDWSLSTFETANRRASCLELMYRSWCSCIRVPSWTRRRLK